MPPELTIVSGGQTGVDRAALDWAIEKGWPHGGYCPKDRIAEDGMIPIKYNLKETKSSKYPVRTRLNIIHSDATLILSPLPLTGGTALTAKYAEEEVEQEATAVQRAKEALVEESSPPADPFMQAEDGEEGSPPAEENIFAAPAKEGKADPAIEHATKKAKREEEIMEARKENEKRQMAYENLSGTVLRLVKELNEKLSILAFEEHDRWSDKWNSLSYPLPEEALEDSHSSED
jgi:hypothetical protein